MGRMLVYADRMSEADTALRQAIALLPDAPLNHWNLALTLLFRGNKDAALAELQSEPNAGLQSLGKAIVYYAMGRSSASDVAMADVEARMATCCRFLVATGYAYRGEVDRALEWLNRAYREHDDALQRIKGHPLLTNLRSDPRYAALLRNMRLAD